MRTTNYDLPNAQYNRTYYAITIEMPVSIDISSATIYMQVKTKVDGKVIKEFSTLADSGITKTGNSFTISQHLCDLQPGEYLYDILIVRGGLDVTRKSYIAGNWIVEETITYKA